MLALCFANVYYGLHLGDLGEGCTNLALPVRLRGLDGASVRDIDEFHVITIAMRHGGVCLNPWGAVAAIIHVIVDSLRHLD